jgi:ADP-heptose:LPS heptosyltransferase
MTHVKSPNIVIAPYSVQLPSGQLNPKNYPYWREVIKGVNTFDSYFNYLSEYHFIQIGREGEEQLCEDFRKDLSFKEIELLLKNSFTFVTVDSFLQHLAWKIGKRGIVIFSQSDPEIFGHKENINLLKDRSYLRPGREQFWKWDQCEWNEDAFVSPDEVIKAIWEFKI